MSSYLHAVRYGYANQGLSKFFNRNVNRENGFSFREYITYLEAQNLRQCNVHHRIQVHPAELLSLVKPDYIVKLENSFEDLRKIELDLELRNIDLSSLRKSKHDTSRIEESNFCGDNQFSLSKHPKTFPSSKNFFDKELAEKVSKLYEIDFESYDYDRNILN